MIARFTAPAARRGLAAKFGGLPRVFWVVWAGTLVNRLGAMVQPFLALYLVSVRDVSVVTAGSVLAVFGAGTYASQLVGGWLTDRIGRRATLTSGMLATGCALGMLGYAQSLPLIFVSAFAVGATIDIFHPASAAIVADVVSPSDRPRAFGLLYWALNLGFSASTVIGGALARQGFAWLFIVDAATCGAFAVLIWRAVPSDRSARGTASVPTTVRHGYRLVIRDRTMVGYSLTVLCFAVVYMQGTTTLPLVMTDAGLSPSSYGLTIGLNGVLVLVLQPLLVDRLARREHSAVAAIGLTLIGTGFGLTALADETWQFATSVLVWTLGEIMFMTVAQTIVADIAPPLLRGRYNGLYGTAWSTAKLVAPLGGAWLLYSFGSGALWSCCFAAGLVGAVGQLLLRSAIRRQASLAASSSPAGHGDGLVSRKAT